MMYDYYLDSNAGEANSLDFVAISRDEYERLKQIEREALQREAIEESKDVYDMLRYSTEIERFDLKYSTADSATVVV